MAEISDTELELVKEQAVQQARIDEIEKYVPEIFANLKLLNKNVNDIPLSILRCKTDFDSEMKAYMHDKFITDIDLNTLETKLEKHVDNEVRQVTKRVDRVGWLVSGFITAGVFIMWYLKIINFGG